ncbi:unnamed protein product [Bemisia tabaci]|uniref:Uncharacterized protein n=1 Tax=Bemisia tabaci TaxID=7038 RepID=A0A9P0AE08_BEMTA|nr:unnamed protein product [Bemisia tabaci]
MQSERTYVPYDKRARSPKYQTRQTQNCDQVNGHLCQNGACLDSQCHCNDGFGGCDCQVPDENECKYRPCDVFAHCTNTLGSFHCSCFPGYTGNGFYCQDIDECANPAIASRCVANAECCNLPAHFLCKCRPGFEGDGEVECRDIDECLQPNACGINTCVDLNECEYKGACGLGALCTNLPGGHHCECPRGYEGDAYRGVCTDINECLHNVCGINAICRNEPGTFQCSCPQGFAGDPFSSCTDVDECMATPCGVKSECVNTNGSFSCKCLPGYSGEPEKKCLDINECDNPNQCGINAKCMNTPGSYVCVCPEGFSGHGQIYCENVNECSANPCGENAVCTDTVGSFVCSCRQDYTGDPYRKCVDIDECAILDKPCGQNAVCENTDPGFTCTCPQGFAGKPDPSVACEQVDVSVLCAVNSDCAEHAECIEGQCFCLNGFKAQGSLCHDIDECLSLPCGPFSVCNNTQGSFQCSCIPGNVGAPPKIPCKPPCDDIKCGEHAFCKNNEQDAYCICEEGWTFSPADVSAGCIDINECDQVHGVNGQCGLNSICTNSLGGFNCECQQDIDECQQNPCGEGALCENTVGSFECSCPPDWLPDPDPSTKCVPILTCKVDKDCPGNAICYDKKFCHCPEPNIGSDCVNPCDAVSCGTNAECVISNNEPSCVCSPGFTGTTPDGCVDIDECDNNPCPIGAVCHNEPGSFSCKCPGGTVGDPFKQGCSQAKIQIGCGPENPCPGSELCIRDDFLEESVCICQRGYLRDAKTGKCRDVNECTELRDKPVCGVNAICKNLPGSYDCQCPPGFNGNPFNSCEECNSSECQCKHPYQLLNGECVLAGCDNGQCPNGAECITIAGQVSYCACPKGFRRQEDGVCEDIDECAEIAQACGYGAECINKRGGYECLCNQGTSGDPYILCSPAQIKCFNHHDCQANEKCIQPGECVCPPPFITDRLDGNKCKSPCEMLSCGINAECNPHDPPRCVCRPGFTGDPLLGCIDIDECVNSPCVAGAKCINEHGSYRCDCPKGVTGEGCADRCARNPCGENTRCRDVNNGYECSCLPGCSGDPLKGCNCETNRLDACSGHVCGKNALCRMTSGSEPECYCPLEFPVGDPDSECFAKRIPVDCRVSGCGKGAHCVLVDSDYSCQCPPGTVGNPNKDCIPEKECSSNSDCQSDKTCSNHQCLDVCSVKGACGLNALCEPVNHRPKCSCPTCYIGTPKTGCYLDSNCSSLSSQKCSLNSDCPSNLTCIDGFCKNPCLYIDNKNILNCTNHKKCHVQNHKPVCICETGYAVNEYGDLICSPNKVECLNNDDCPSNLACYKSKCSDPCEHTLCSANKTCSVLAHQPVCMCTKDCQPSTLSICMRDSGCPPDLACRNYLCINPCANFSCPARSPCNVEDHKPVCKFCPVGFSADSKFGCVRAVGCVDNEECALNMACINNQCQNPCHMNNPCTNQHDCQVQNHQPVCVKVCSCHKNSNCGPNHYCDGCHCVIDPASRTQSPLPGCEHCPPGVRCDPFTGACMKMNGTAKFPHPCQSDSDCLEIEACYDGQCGDLCALAGTCAPSAECQVYKHRPVCKCPPGYEGDPAVKCFLPEPLSCVTNADCSFMEACINKICQHPCDVHNPCAQNAICSNTNHGASCGCIEGYEGNAYVGCTEVAAKSQRSCQYNGDCPSDKVCDRLNRICVNPCFEDSCGLNAVCIPINHGTDCRCLAGFHGNPYLGCTSIVQCHNDNECNADEACINGKCSNPCRCGPNAICEVYFHKANCKCLTGYSGNPTIGCIAPTNPCNPNPCGYQALCEVDEGNPICFCPKGMTGNPFKTCIPEGDECSPNPCGPYSGCRVVHGAAVCYCLPEYEGDPPSKPCHLPKNPCSPSPCGPNTQCSLLSDGFAKCTCLPGYVESPNTIRGCVEKRNRCEPNPCGHGAICDPNQAQSCFCPEPLIGNPYRSCTAPSKTLCLPGPCGQNADCYVVGGTEQCYCKMTFTGDPYTSCRPGRSSPCDPNPCGPFAECSISPEGKQHCACLSGMAGDPMSGCSGPECRSNKDCSPTQACLGWKCLDPCPGACGIGASCRVEKHHPQCVCDSGLTGNPLIKCVPVTAPSTNPCEPNPCGLNTLCSVVKNKAACSCLPDFIGDPQSGCRLECVLNSDCPSNQACISHHCKDPCSLGNVCGVGAVCISKDHVVTCVCQKGYSGDPFIQCISKSYLPILKNETLPCDPSPCEPNSYCSVHSGQVAMCNPCGSSGGYWSPACHPDCLFDSDCSFNLACIGQKCMDPCSGSCGFGAQCTVHHHQPICTCPQGLVGNPFEHCHPPTASENQKQDPCAALQCGANAVCKVSFGHTTCVCSPGYQGNPYLGCRPECVLNSDCPSALCCVNNKCEDPCIGACGVNAECQAVNHLPVCYCPKDHSGDPFVSCYAFKPIFAPVMGHPSNPCDPSPCGPNSRCLISKQGYASCSCLPGYRGVPPVCKSECVISAECPQSQACINQKCADPCPGTCGLNARCDTINHNPICNCAPGYVGDPFINCYLPPAEEIPKIPKIDGNPCDPSPCGSNSICQVTQGHPVCSCAMNYTGKPPFCRPECVMSQECPHDQACIREKCRDPCTQSCGYNAKCSVINHTPFCSCLPGYEGDAFVGCSSVPPTVQAPIPTNPCTPSPCGENAHCTSVDGTARCTCIPPYVGNPYAGGCRPECVIPSDCAPHETCLSSHCRDPCPGVCGRNAVCKVVNHIPQCSCLPGFIGNPFQSCKPEPPKPLPPKNPCESAMCGPNSICRVSDGHAVCSCQRDFVGTPPACRPECVQSGECDQTKACVNQKCVDPCPGTCGVQAVCQVLNHNPMCSCPPSTTGDPFVKCVEEAPKEAVESINPCVPSPCGANSECHITERGAMCSCVPGMLGAPPHCRPECSIHADCPTKLACINNKCRDPCMKACGVNSQCAVVNHKPVCSCFDGYQGDPFTRCNPVRASERTPAQTDPCFPTPCGVNADCVNNKGVASCVCLSGFYGNPHSGCHRECESNTDCASSLVCSNYKCVDPCPETCGIEAVCTVSEHKPVCACAQGFSGDPFIQCHPIPVSPSTPPPVLNPCYPSPCGANSQCRPVNGEAICSCLPQFVGNPPKCHPECTENSDCPADRACINLKCANPCQNTCGIRAQCTVRNHNPICTCPAKYTGDPFIQCSAIPSSFIQVPSKSSASCQPSPCGPHSQCQIVDNKPVCSCTPGFIGSPPKCRPECVISTDCSSHLTCVKQKCTDPCPGSCGVNAQCQVLNHVPTCSCMEGFTGDSFVHCSPIPMTGVNLETTGDPCLSSPCGINAVCQKGFCFCIGDYEGNPYEECRPECAINHECDRSKACIANKCQDPCPGTCGQFSQCSVVNHMPICSCPQGMTGDPFFSCRMLTAEPSKPKDVCIPSPCGPNSKCQTIEGNAACSCLPGYVGTPPNCKLECVVSSECPSQEACINSKCIDPCTGACGVGARCEVVNHSPICSCGPELTVLPSTPPEEDKSVCNPSLCGPNSHCEVEGEIPVCSCLPNFKGRPPHCRPECIINPDCPSNLACINQKCVNPCPGSCGINAECQVISHSVHCSCSPGLTGNPFVQCIQQEKLINPCTPSPCGPNAYCRQQKNAGSCICIPDYHDTEAALVDPCTPSPCGPNSQCRKANNQPVCSCLPEYKGAPPNCQPECVSNNECPLNKACQNYKCRNPCSGACGLQASCEVISHSPVCSCPAGFMGDPFVRCMLPLAIPSSPMDESDNPCLPSPCGPNSVCRIIKKQAACSCLHGFIGTAPNCRPECTVSSDCSASEACIVGKCRDPCIGSCSSNAECRVQNHAPVCSCVEGYSGDPFSQCSPIMVIEEPSGRDPCTPSPCGANADCFDGNCKCRPSYYGDPYSGCRPECTLNSECPSNKACTNQRCVNPCLGICGQDARCDVINHAPSCSCPPGLTGNPLAACRSFTVQNDTLAGDLCNPNPCGPNSICRITNGFAVCSCQPGLIGSPPLCRPECIVSTECPLTQACIRSKCADPCTGTCGVNAECRVINHSPICSCEPGHTGDPFRQCYAEPMSPGPLPSTENPCKPSPCGPNSKCQVSEGNPVCSCSEHYMGSPPHCRPVCTIDPECPSHLACIGQKCADPCPGSCGSNARCSVINHSPMCACLSGYSGDPFTGCSATEVSLSNEITEADPCYPSPCGSNARCQNDDGFVICECIAEYQGNPYEGCRPECLVSSDCPMNLACIGNKCHDPCPGTCGFSAICTVSNHNPICTCPEGTTGDAFKLCQLIQKSDSTVTLSSPCSRSPCGPNAVCRVINNAAMCECLPDFYGSPSDSGCRPECVISADCPRNKACSGNKCQDPCPGICGTNAICHVVNHSPVCSCPVSMVGDPFIECRLAPAESTDPCFPSPCHKNGICNIIGGSTTCIYPECIINQDCPRDKACFSQKCSDPCYDACGVNAICHAVNHQPVCFCPPGFTGEPQVLCKMQPTSAEPRIECTSDTECNNDRACVSGSCKNPCATSSNVCGINAECHVQFHRPICACKSGFIGNALVQCQEAGCQDNSGCSTMEACINGECVNPCTFSQCGVNAECHPDNNHRARCSCPASFTGDPLVKCERPQCSSNDDCPQNLACQNKRCVNPCICANNALCIVISHNPTCQCPPGFVGNPYRSCVIAPIEVSPGCKQDSDCPSRHVCMSGDCRDPCIGIQPCGQKAECKVLNTLPLRTLSCQCLPGYVGDASVQCERAAAQVEHGCKGDAECLESEVCINLLCVNPCAVSTPCAPSAECQADNHRAMCKCPSGLVGDPFVNCYKASVKSPECSVDSDCATDVACINQRCQDPCILSNLCGAGAQCSVSMHRPVCDCPADWAGDPQVQCYKPECQSNADCVYDKACVENSCLDPCQETTCGRGAECKVQNHHASCTCPLGTQGDPLISCIGVICQFNDDCADHESCDRVNHKCRPVCQEKTCATNAACSAANHQATCTCMPGTQGNPYTDCSTARLPAPVCSQDSDCPSKLACINQRCENPCLASHICTKEQDCRVLDTLPLRSVVCECPSDTIATPEGSCKPIAGTTKDPKCRSSEECKNNEKCFKGVCTDACRVEPCGVNAQCIGKKHQAVCSCPPGYIGSPYFECSSLPKLPLPVLPECTRDNDCSYGLGCNRQRCVNPCTTKVCSRNAFCHVEGHKPICRCPPGFSGDPMVECKPSTEAATIGCSSNAECPLQESCVNRLCISPCNCGPNADCKVLDHYPICSCSPGFSGNPQFGCVKVDCESDSHCLSSQTCYNGKCVNPCILEDACAPNAECYGDNHQTACRCAPGYEGNPLVRCEHVECHSDSECRSDQKCFNLHCVNPCQYSPCAPNAVCYVNNHNAACRCPESLPLGNPAVNCERQPSFGKEPECKYDTDCVSGLACLTNKCVDPCYELVPCSNSARCNVLDSVPVKTLTCTCSEGWVPNAEGECRPVVVPSPPGCATNQDCPSNETCISRICRNPCNCGANANCIVQDHYPICSCQEGFEGNPHIACRSIGCRTDGECESGKACLNSHCIDPCLVSNPCGFDAECYTIGNRAECRCVSGYRGDPYDRCTVIGCRTNNDCPDDRACINSQCINPCAYEHPCAANSECKVNNHLALCRCPPGELGNPYVGCRPEPKPECKVDADCPAKLACFNDVCQNPCTALQPCTSPAECSVVSSLPVRTMLCVCPNGYASSGSGTCKAAPPIIPIGCIADSDCPLHKACVNALCMSPCNCPSYAECQVSDHKPTCSCPPGFEGDPNIECVKIDCPANKGFIRAENGECVCPLGYALNANDECQPCYINQGYKIDENDRCTCALDRGFIVNEFGECVCPTEFGYQRDTNGNCVLVGECEKDDNCPNKKFCNLNTQICEDACQNTRCGVNAFCNATNHKAVCLCIAGYNGDPYSVCNHTHTVFRTDFPRPDMVVSCLSDGVQVEIHITETGFNGVLYVKGHSKDESCRRIVSVPQEYANQRTEIFKVHFGSCGLLYKNGLADFVLVIQKHPKLVTYKAQAYHIKCVYSTGEQNVTLGFNVSMLTTAGTIANTGPPPTCTMKIVTHTGQEINSAEIGDNLMLQVDVQPSSIYGGFARSCIAKTMEDSVENEYIVTDENGCATDPSIFGDWDYNPDTQSLLATFNAFKFPSSDNIRFQCNIRVCFGKCQPSDCRGYNAYGKRRRRDLRYVSKNSSTDVSEALLAGQLREEITIQSNAILTLERSEERVAGPPDAPEPQRAEDICISVIGFIIALIVTALLALVAVAVAVSCWLLAYRRRPTLAGPLPHPPEFPNPLFTTPEPVAEPSPDYHS